MFTEEEWKIMYNNVFKIFPSPDALIKQINVKVHEGMKVFKSTSEFISFAYNYGYDKIMNDDIEYILKNNGLKQEIENKINILLEKINEEWKTPHLLIFSIINK